MATTPSAPASQHMATLEDMLDLIFKHSGLFIKELHAGGGTGRMKQQLQRVVPHATDRFHDALDELENEVRLAQTVVRRDMALLKQDRKKKEAAAKQHEVEKARLAAESKTIQPAADAASVKVEKAATPTPPEEEAMQDAPEPAKAKEPEAEAAPKRESEDTKVPPPIETNLEPPRDPLFDTTPTTGNQHESEFDFDAMFADAMDESGDHNPHNDMMDTSGDMDFNLDDGNHEPSLLRGLEAFAKGSDEDNANQTSNMDIDFTMPDLPGLDANTDSNPNANADGSSSSNANTAAKPVSAPAPAPVPTPEPAPKAEEPKPEEPKPAAQPPPEEKKEETTTNDDMMGTMVTDDLEDLFNMDEYENPEQSSFDDAFFNFDQ